MLQRRPTSMCTWPLCGCQTPKGPLLRPRIHNAAGLCSSLPSAPSTQPGPSLPADMCPCTHQRCCLCCTSCWCTCMKTSSSWPPNCLSTASVGAPCSTMTMMRVAVGAVSSRAGAWGPAPKPWSMQRVAWRHLCLFQAHCAPYNTHNHTAYLLYSHMFLHTIFACINCPSPSPLSDCLPDTSSLRHPALPHTACDLV